MLLSTATIQLLPAPLFIPAYAACPYGLMLATVGGSARTMGWHRELGISSYTAGNS